MSLQPTWERVKSVLEVQFQGATYDNYFRHLVFVGEENGMLYLGVPNEHTAWLLSDPRPLVDLRRAVAAFLGMDEVAVNLEIVIQPETEPDAACEVREMA